MQYKRMRDLVLLADVQETLRDEFVRFLPRVAALFPR